MDIHQSKKLKLPDIDVAEKWDVVIQPQTKYFHLDLKDLWNYRDLALMFFKRDFTTFYKQTILGPLWYLIQPSVTALTYFIIFGKIANLPTNGLPPFLFYLSGIVLWGFFATCLTNNSEIFSKNANLFSKVYFPRLLVPISVAMSGVVAFAIQFCLLLCVTIFYILNRSLESPHFYAILIVPLLTFYVGCLGLGVGLIISALTVRFRDLAFATTFMTQLLMYASPIVYSLQQIPSQYLWFYYLNPMTAPIETLRHVLFNSPAISSSLWLSNSLVSLIILVLGVFLFTRAEVNAMDTV